MQWTLSQNNDVEAVPPTPSANTETGMVCVCANIARIFGTRALKLGFGGFLSYFGGR